MNVPCPNSKNTCAPIQPQSEWKSINWKVPNQWVRKLQVRIAKAVKQRRYGKVKSLQWILTHSYYGRLLAIRRVVTNKGRKTPGVDGVIWDGDRSKMEAIYKLHRRGYRPEPLRRVYIKKKNGKLRPLGIPTMLDRAMQALYSLALKPVAETTADLNSYGFREYRSCTDAIVQCCNVLSRKDSAEWILEADISACFDNISHEWLNKHILMDAKILQAWLKAGYMEEGYIYPTRAGTPQGGIVSPVLANMTLDGLEAVCRRAIPIHERRGRILPKVNVIRYADDFIVTARSKEMLEKYIVPAIKTFLDARGLQLSDEKTRITRIDEGFDFLGEHLRKFNGSFTMKPAKCSVKGIIDKTKAIIKASRGNAAWKMIKQLNPIIRGWAQYHRYVAAGETFWQIDHLIFQHIWRWAKSNHRNQGMHWIRRRYFLSRENSAWVFSDNEKLENGWKRAELLKASSIKTQRHTKIRANANPYDTQINDYFAKRKKRKDVPQPNAQWSFVESFGD